MQREITESAYKFQRKVEKKKRVIVGVNQFAHAEKAPIKILRIDPAVEKKVVRRLNRVRKERNNQKVGETLDKLRNVAEDGQENLILPILHAVKEHATLGEICDTLRKIYGEHKPSTIF